MGQYLFIFGRDPELSFAELVSFLKSRQLKHNIIKKLDIGGIVEISSLDFNINSLGGTVKIGRILSDINDILIEKDKIKYAISLYKGDSADAKSRLKGFFKEQKLKALYKKGMNGTALSPSEVIKYRLIDDGFELLVYDDIIAKTVAVFNPAEHETRDKERPIQDYKKSISIRLAKILINLSCARHSLLDPFCGTGVILQEALLLGLDVTGIDKDSESIRQCETNLKWLKHRYNIQNKWKLINGDSSNLNKFNIFEAVATEPYLGPFLNKFPQAKEVSKTIAELEALYLRFFSNIRVNGRIAIIMPNFRTEKGIIRLNFPSIIRKCGYRPVGIESVKWPIDYMTGWLGREIWVIENISTEQKSLR